MTDYVHGHHESVLRSHCSRTAVNSAAHLLPHLRPGLRVLDVGAGPGTITCDLADLVRDDMGAGLVIALETNESSLALSRTKATSRGTANVEFMVGDVHHLDLPDASVDVAHAHQVLQHLPDPVQALREMVRVTRPGGLVAVRDSDYPGFRWFPHEPALDEWLDLYVRMATSTGGAPDAGIRYRSWARAAGLDDRCTITQRSWVYADAESTHWWGDMWAERTLASSYAERARTRLVPRMPTCSASRTAGAAGRSSPTPCSPCPRWSSWPASDAPPTLAPEGVRRPGR